MSNKCTTISFENQVFFIGIDVHKRSWSVTIRMNGMELKTFSMQPGPAELASFLRKNYPDGIYKSAYEAGFCGFKIHYDLIENGIENVVVHAADIPTTNKEKVTKTDKVDSRKIAKELEHNNLNCIYIPSKDHQQIRSLCRHRYQSAKDCTRIKNRIKGMLNFYGVKLPSNEEMRERCCHSI
jgi:transposase